VPAKETTKKCEIVCEEEKKVEVAAPASKGKAVVVVASKGKGRKLQHLKKGMLFGKGKMHKSFAHVAAPKCKSVCKDVEIEVMKKEYKTETKTEKKCSKHTTMECKKVSWGTKFQCLRT
jgi:hypothetical protein